MTTAVDQASNIDEEIMNLNGHTLTLIQFSSNEETRTYIDSQTPYEAMETFLRIYENFLINKQGIQCPSTADDQKDKDEGDADAEMNDNEEKSRKGYANIEYKLDDVLKFVDQLYDLSGMTYNERAHGYTAHGKAWFKGKIHAYMRRLAAE